MRNYSIEYVFSIIFFIIILLIVPLLSLAKYLCKSDCEPNYEIITTDLNYPWGFVFLDKTRILISERSGFLKLIDGKLIQNIETRLQVNFSG